MTKYWQPSQMKNIDWAIVAKTVQKGKSFYWFWRYFFVKIDKSKLKLWIVGIFLKKTPT